MKQWKRDLYLSVGMFLFSVGNIIYGITLQDNVMKYTLARADTYLILWLSCLAILSVLLFIRTMKNKPDKAAPVIFEKSTVFTAVWTCVYVFLLDQIGFVLDTALYLFVMFWVYTVIKKGRMEKKVLVKNIIIWFILSVVVTVAVYFSFSVALGAALPEGSIINVRLG